MSTQWQNEFELHARAILGLPVDTALRVPGSDLRLFGKPEAFTRRRMGVALARGEDIEQARQRARRAAAKVSPTEA